MKNEFWGRQLHIVSPGRVNLLGEHVDYNDGAVMPAAIDRAVHLSALGEEGSRVRLKALDLKESVVFDLYETGQQVDVEGKPLPEWALYPAGVAHVLQQHGFAVCGLRAEFSSDLPMGSGLSSSAAVEVGFGVLWQTLGGWQIERMKLAQLCLEAEREYVGVNCGLMDQFACAHGVKDHALYFDTRSLQWLALPLPRGVSLIIANSCLPRSLTGSAYNERHKSCEEALAILKPLLPGIRALRDVSPADLARHAQALPEITLRRARHVVTECARMPRALEYLQAGDVGGFGLLMLECHASLRDDYAVSLPELDALVEIAAGLPGCWGARLTGAGFGGCTVNLVDSNQAAAFSEALARAYTQRTGRTAEILQCRASQGAKVLD